MSSSRCKGFPSVSAGKKSVCNAGDLGLIPGFDPWVGKICWRREWLPTPVFWLGEFHGVYSSPWGHKEWDMTEWLSYFTVDENYCGRYKTVQSRPPLDTGPGNCEGCLEMVQSCQVSTENYPNWLMRAASLGNLQHCPSLRGCLSVHD